MTTTHKKIMPHLKKTEKLLMDRYLLKTDKSAFLGQGSFSVVQAAIDTKTNEKVAVKTYKIGKNTQMNVDAINNVLFKFRRQVSVLKQIEKFNTRKQQVGFFFMFEDSFHESTIGFKCPTLSFLTHAF